MSFKLSVEAEEDIIAIAEQGARMFGGDQAKRYHDEHFALFDLIAANPRIARERNEIEPPVRIPSKHISSFIGLKAMRKFS
jgi:toxin ParE1/3/4